MKLYNVNNHAQHNRIKSEQFLMLSKQDHKTTSALQALNPRHSKRPSGGSQLMKTQSNLNKYAKSPEKPIKFDLKLIQKFIEKDIERKLSLKQKLYLKQTRELQQSMLNCQLGEYLSDNGQDQIMSGMNPQKLNDQLNLQLNNKQISQAFLNSTTSINSPKKDR